MIPILFRCLLSALLWFMDNHLCPQLTDIRLQLEASGKGSGSYARLERLSQLD